MINYNALRENINYRAYFLGYFLADGWLCIKGNSYRVGFECKDKDLLEEINKPIGARISERVRKVRTGTICKIYGLGMSGNIGRDVFSASKGVKDFREEYYNMSIEEKDSFILGFFDGDGSVCKYSRKESIRIIFYTVGESSYEIITDYLGNLGISFSESRDNRGCEVRQLSIGTQSSVLNLYNRWYRNGVYLKRKYNIMHESLVLQEMVPLHSNV
jgi:intein/homing endonuclease